MIPADRERLSQLLGYVTHELNAPPDDKNDDAISDWVNEARAIVDQPAHTTPPGFSKGGYEPGHEVIHLNPDEARAFASSLRPPNPALDAFLTEPIHEYTDRIPTRHRHRAPNPWWLVVAFTLAGILAVALTASTTTTGGTERPNPQTRPAKPPSGAARTGFRPGDAPWNANRRPGRPGNGLGVLLP
jgi:hypothetical protein